MSYRVTYTANFEKEVKRLAKKYPSLKEDVLDLIELLKKDPRRGTSLGKNLYKVRVTIESKARGKSGGARAITYVLFSDKTVYLTSIFDKSEQDSISILTLLKILRSEGL